MPLGLKAKVEELDLHRVNARRPWMATTAAQVGNNLSRFANGAKTERY